MINNFKSNKPGILVFVLSLFANTLCDASSGGRHTVGWGGGDVHSHGGGYGHNHGHGNGGYYDRGGFYFGGGWGGPNVIINVPVERYYSPVCENVEVCDSYGECWLERYCN
jgi:uncharacterized membrane protein